MKTCNVCKKEKSVTEFTKDKYQPDGLDRKCRVCKAKIYTKIDKKARSAWRKSYFENNRDVELKNCEIYRNKYKKERNSYIARYYKDNPWKGAAKTAKYRAAKLNQTPKWLTKEQIKEIEQFYFSCPKGYEVDHIVPLQGKQVRGLHAPWNLKIIPMKENRKKSNKLVRQECLSPTS